MASAETTTVLSKQERAGAQAAVLGVWLLFNERSRVDGTRR
jgi:hypothetical protein